MKICIELEPEYWNLPFLMNVKKVGLNVVSSRNFPDFYVKKACEISEDDLSTGKKFIALERRDGADIGHRELLQHPNVVKYVKQYRLCSWDLNNSAALDGRGFVRFLTREAKARKRNITERDFKKVDVGWNFLHYDRMEPYVHTPPLHDSKRQIDVFFAGSSMYGDINHPSGSAISHHRRMCIDRLKKIKNIKKVVIDGRVLSKKDYIEAVYNSKVIVSPWGWGEICYRDYEAIFAGCILLKPFSGFIESTCAIFNSKKQDWVDPLFQDLELKIFHSLSKYSSTLDERHHRRNQMIERRDNISETISKIFSI